MLKLELKSTVWHQKDLCMLNNALDIENFSSWQTSWTPSWKWPFSNGQKKGDFSMLKLELKPTIWHQKDLCMLNIAYDIENVSFW